MRVPQFLGSDAKKGTHITFFGGILGVQKGGPKRAIFFVPLCGGRAKRAEKASCGETVVQKDVSWRLRFFSAPLRVSGPFRCFKFKASLKGAEKKRTLKKHPFGQPFLRTTPSPFLWRTPRLLFLEVASCLARSHRFSLLTEKMLRGIASAGECMTPLSEQKRHIKLLHIKPFSVRPGHRSSRSGIRTTRFMFLGFRG